MAKSQYYVPSKTVLLTGAGFTKPFGGYLAKQMWAEILNQPEIQQSPQLREKLLNNLDFESVYDEIQESTADQAQKVALSHAVNRAYEEMDAILSRPDGRIAELAHGVCRTFIGRFGRAKNPNQRGYFFTLNQDLFIERFYLQDQESLQIPGVGHPDWFGKLPPDLGAEHEVVLPDETKLQTFKEQFWAKGTGSFVYVKLHGSFCWWAHDGSEALVIGTHKEEKLKEPLLHWYQELFRQIVNEDDMTLVVIGYGFRDKHINDIIADAIGRQLRLVVISPEMPDAFRDHLQSVHGINAEPIHRGNEIWNGIYGYWCGQVTDFCDPRQSYGLPPRGQSLFTSLRL